MGNLPIVKALVTAKADINLADKKGRTALKFGKFINFFNFNACLSISINLFLIST